MVSLRKSLNYIRFYWIEYVRSLFEAKVNVISAPDSGLFFLDIPPFGEEPKERTPAIYYDLINTEVDPPNSKCVLANPS